MISLYELFILIHLDYHRTMSSDPNVVILYSITDSDVEGSMSSTAFSPPPIPLVLVLPLSASGEDTEPFEEDETAPTPHVSPIAPPEITRAPTDTSSSATTIPSEPRLMFPRRKTTIGPSKKVCPATSTFRIPAIPISPAPPAIPATTSISTSLLPLRKRARFTTPASPTTESESEPPPVYHVGESSRAAAAREPIDVTLEDQLGAQ